MRLSDRVVAALSCPVGKKDALFFDGDLPGFGVRVTAQGKRMFLFQYRAGPKVRRLRIGQWGEDGEGLTAAQARKLVSIQYGIVSGGGDPVAQRKAVHQATVEVEAKAKRRRAADAYTLQALIAEWEKRHLAHLRESYRRDAVGRLQLHLKALLETPASAITRADAVRAVDRIASTAGETTARRTIGYARSAFTWAAKRGAVTANPFEGVPVPGQEVRRDRVLSGEEVAEVWAASYGLAQPYGSFVRILLLTLQRREEVAGMRWGELAEDLSTWTLPAERAKNGKAHVVHLAEPVRAEIEALGRDKPIDLVFRAPLATIGADGKYARRGLTAFSYTKRRLDEEIAKARAEAAAKADKAIETMPGWRMHDFRRSGVTALAGLGFAPHVCDRLLNHVTGAIQGVAAVYQRAEFLAERTAALEAWAGFVNG